MHYYPEDQSSENLDKVRRQNVCAECGRRLMIYIDLRDRRKYIACSGQVHEGIAREYKPQSTDYQSNIRREVELEQNHGVETARALQTIPKQGQLTQPQAEHILSLVYPNCPRDEIIRCAILCRDFGLHPLMKEVYLIPFKDKAGKDTYATVLGINATRKLMSLRGTYSYTDDTPRIMTEAEQKRIFGEIDAVNIVAITKLRTKEGLEAPGYGRWPKNTSPYGMDKGNTKANMAFIRSERNAFGRLSPDALPPNIEVIDEAYVEVPEIGKVAISTGEIIEGDSIDRGATSEATELKSSPIEQETNSNHFCDIHQCAFEKKQRGSAIWWAHKDPDDKWCNEKKKKGKESNGEPAQPESEKPGRDPGTINTINELYQACHADFGLQPADVISELGVNSQADISDTPAECYQKIKTVR